MGITSEEFFQNSYNVMFAPAEFFNAEEKKISLRLSFCIIIAIAAVNKYAFSISDEAVYSWTFIFPLLLSIICTLFVWLLSALFFEYTAKIFDKSGHISVFLYLSAFAMIPSILYAPLNLLKQAGQAGYIISAVLSCLLCLRLLYLYVYAAKSAYGISFARAFMLIILPFAAIIPAVCLSADVIAEISRIFSI